MKGESAIWSVLMGGVGVSFVIVAVALVVVSKHAADEAPEPDPSAMASEELAPAIAALLDAGLKDAAAPEDASPPADADVPADADADADAAPDAAPAPTSEPVAASTPVAPKPATPKLPSSKTKPYYPIKKKKPR